MLSLTREKKNWFQFCLLCGHLFRPDRISQYLIDLSTDFHHINNKSAHILLSPHLALHFWSNFTASKTDKTRRYVCRDIPKIWRKCIFKFVFFFALLSQCLKLYNPEDRIKRLTEWARVRAWDRRRVHAWELLLITSIMLITHRTVQVIHPWIT